MTEITRFKREARDAGRKGVLFSEFATNSGLKYQDFNTGIHVEIVLSWMLGTFMRHKKDGLKVDISDHLDRKEKADFLLCRGSRKTYVQVKFNNDQEFVLPTDIKLIKLGPSSKFEGHRYLESMRGDMAFIELMEKSGLYKEEELYDFFDEHADVGGMFIGIWETIKN